jgi:hypothetical protein
MAEAPVTTIAIGTLPEVNPVMLALTAPPVFTSTKLVLLAVSATLLALTSVTTLSFLIFPPK